MYIIIKGKDSRTFKGKTITEFQDNLCSSGYPPEMGERERDVVKWFEKKHGRRARKKELEKLENV